MSICGSDPDDCETVCDTSISESCVHNRYLNDEFDEGLFLIWLGQFLTCLFNVDGVCEYLPLGQMSFVKWEKCEKRRLEMLTEVSILGKQKSNYKQF
jgi:hypothetical protein